MRAAMVIGLGGTGCRVIKDLKEIRQWRDNQSLDDYNGFKSLSLDTDTEHLDDGANSIHLVIDPVQARTIYNMPENNRKWLANSVIEPISKGAGQVRMQGKLGFFVNYNRIMQRIDGALQQLNNKITSQGDELQIFIVANSVSGTGSGAFVDLGFLVRKIINRNPALLAKKPNVILMLTLPVDANQNQHFPNASYALMELDYYMSGNKYEIDDINTAGGAPITHNNYTGEVGKKPFDFVYLVGSRNLDAVATDSQVNKLISEYIYCELFSKVGDNAGGRRDDFRKYLREKDHCGLPTCYSTFGLAIMEYPASQITKLSAIMYIKKALDEWRTTNPTPPLFNLERIFLGGPDDKNFNDQLTREVIIKQDESRKISKKLTSLFQNTKDQAYSSFVEDDYNTDKLKALIKRIDESFSDTVSLDINTASNLTPGIASYVINHNVERLYQTWFESVVSDTDPNSFNGIRETLLNHLFGNQGGIQLAKSTIDTISKQLSTLRGKSYAQPVFEMEDIVEGIDSIKSDVFLMPFRGVLIKRLITTFKGRVDQYIQTRLLSAIYDKSGHLITSVLDDVNNLKEKLDNFELRIDKLQDDLNEELDHLKTPPSINGHVVKGGKIEDTAKKLSNTAFTRKPFIDFIKKELRGLLETEWRRDGTGFSLYKPQEVIGLMREFCINLQGKRNVIEEFEDECQESAATDNPLSAKIRELCHTSSQLSMHLNESDPTSAVFKVGSEDGKLNRIFYMDGELINSNEAANASDNVFTKRLHDENLIAPTDWGKVNQGLGSHFVVYFLKERGGFPLHFWNDLTFPAWTTALAEIRSTPDDGQSPRYLSRIDIDFPGFLKSDMQRMIPAKTAFWLGVISGAFEVAGSDAFNLKKQSNSSGISRKNVSVIPRDYNHAVRKLAASKELTKKVAEACKANRTAMGDIEFIIAVEKMINGEFPPIVMGVDESIKHERESLIIKWIRKTQGQTTDYCALWNSRNPDYQLGNELSDTVMEITTRDNDHPLPGFYCSDCNHWLSELGKTDDELHVLVEEHICTKPIT